MYCITCKMINSVGSCIVSYCITLQMRSSHKIVKRHTNPVSKSYEQVIATFYIMYFRSTKIWNLNKNKSMLKVDNLFHSFMVFWVNKYILTSNLLRSFTSGKSVSRKQSITCYRLTWHYKRHLHTFTISMFSNIPPRTEQSLLCQSSQS